MPYSTGIRTPRYVADFDTGRIPTLFADALVIGSGVAGLRAAIAAAEAGSVIVATKAAACESNTHYAQGGVAAVTREEDSIAGHLEDTLRAGCGLCLEPAVLKAVTDGPRRVRELIEWGARFDGSEAYPDLALEGGHAVPRILHAHGDATGEEIEGTLLRVASAAERITIMENTFAVDILTADGSCRGALLHDGRAGFIAVWAKKTVIATGGCGMVFRETTNPQVATGDGIAMAYRAGAAIENVEFMQFHPTTLYVAGACRFLLSEAMRGEGGRLTDKTGAAFMLNYHPSGDLAPRDVVSRSIIEEMKRTGRSHVYLDLTHLDPEKIRRRFPAIVALVDSFHIDVSRDRIPVHPSAHYMVGGIMTDCLGRTTVPNLYAVGEAASTGMHGANRLASNSLLEGLVFGAEAGEEIARRARPGKIAVLPPIANRLPEQQPPMRIDLADLRNSVRFLMWRQVGIVRNETLLRSADDALQHWAAYTLDHAAETAAGWELKNMLTLSSLITTAALERRETRGVHSREDFPRADGAVGKPSVITREAVAEPPGREDIDWE